MDRTEGTTEETAKETMETEGGQMPEQSLEESWEQLLIPTKGRGTKEGSGGF